MMRTLTAVAAAALLLANGPVQAQRAASTPSLEGAETSATTPPPPPGFPAPLGGDIVYGSQVETHLETDGVAVSHSATRVSVFDDTDLTGFLNYRGWLSFNVEAKLERNRADNNNSYFVDRDAFLRSEGVTLRQLYATVRPTDSLSLYGGKIHPGFGSAYDSAPGQFYNFGNDYEQDERIGLGIGYGLPALGPDLLGLDTVRLTAETYFLDTSVLSRSLLSTPSLADPAADRLRRYTKEQYGPSNTGRFNSGTLSLRGGRAERGLVWQVSLTREATNMPGGRTENGQSIGASYDPGGDGIPLGPRLGVTPFAEYTHLTNFGGIAGLERHYAVAGLAFTYARWVVNFAAGLRSSAGVAHGTDHQENVSFTYEVLPRLLIGGGYNLINVDGRASSTLAPSLSYRRTF